MPILKAGVLYFALVFGAGFVLGTIRTLWVVPRVGTRKAELMETPKEAATKTASANSKTPATRAARLSASPCAALARNLQSTTTADKISTALSPPKASRAGLCARHAAKSDTAASTLIHAIVRVCSRWIRRIASEEAVCSTEAIYDIMAPHSDSSQSKTPCTLPLG